MFLIAVTFTLVGYTAGNLFPIVRKESSIKEPVPLVNGASELNGPAENALATESNKAKTEPQIPKTDQVTSSIEAAREIVTVGLDFWSSGRKPLEVLTNPEIEKFIDFDWNGRVKLLSFQVKKAYEEGDKIMVPVTLTFESNGGVPITRSRVYTVTRKAENKKWIILPPMN